MEGCTHTYTPYEEYGNLTNIVWLKIMCYKNGVILMFSITSSNVPLLSQMCTQLFCSIPSTCYKSKFTKLVLERKLVSMDYITSW